MKYCFYSRKFFIICVVLFPVCLVCILCGTTCAQTADIEGYLLNKVIQPWVNLNASQYQYSGFESSVEYPFTWSFVDRGDPDMKSTFALRVEMTFCLTEETAHKAFIAKAKPEEFGDASKLIAMHLDAEVRIYDALASDNIRRQVASGLLKDDAPDLNIKPPVGGWVAYRVGTCVFFVHCFSIDIALVKDLAFHIATQLSQMPLPTRDVRERGEAEFKEMLDKYNKSLSEKSDLQ